MGSTVSSPETVEPGKTLIADVASAGELMFAPRRLRLLLGASSVCVRAPEGRLIWLETGGLSAFTDADGQVRIVHHGDGTILVPRDTGADARALESISAFRAWIDACSQSAPVPAEPYLGRPSNRLTLSTEDGRSVAITRDLETGIIFSARGRSLRGNFELQVRSVEIRETTADDFAPV
jgi:hypothetical protein